MRYLSLTNGATFLPSRACRLESLSRTLLISALPSGSKPQTLLKADRNVQRRYVPANSHSGGPTRRLTPAHLGFRDMEANGASSELHAMWEEEDECVLLRPRGYLLQGVSLADAPDLDLFRMVSGNEEHLLHSIKIYRQTFAELLVVGSQLRRLEGAFSLASSTSSRTSLTLPLTVNLSPQAKIDRRSFASKTVETVRLWTRVERSARCRR